MRPGKCSWNIWSSFIRKAEMQFDFGFHWTPRDNRQAILKEGLVVMSPCRTSNVEFGYLCFGVDPRRAWQLTNTQLQDEIELWDCWQVIFASQDHVEFLPDWGAVIRELRCQNSIPPDRLWLVGERALYVHETIYKPEWERFDEETGEIINQKKD